MLLAYVRINLLMSMIGMMRTNESAKDWTCAVLISAR
jgi:hypothetical protein